jgi:hypothetical protein
VTLLVRCNKVCEFSFEVAIQRDHICLGLNRKTLHLLLQKVID